MNDDFSEYQDLIRHIEALPKETPSAHFTQRAMENLPEHSVGLLSKLRQIESEFNYGWISPSESVSKATCFFYYFIAGLFYMIIGIVSMIGISKIGIGTETMNWVAIQPYLAIGTAIWLFALGIALVLDGRAGIRAARYGTMFYIFFAVVNSILMWPYLHIPYAVIFIIALAATSAFMGIMLVQAVQKMELRTV